ncbi:MAG TPA: LytTR family DNA-binding domain-containing protein [Ferruginibacter sp.]|nr:response regulator transcription factor [Ferruginibacter sp.]HNA00881.1 LytTR family DNA-binding domain-containing protein [Ferruginibacter sp.]HNJ93122.1 LytTR family DNA-binding domain-containing protein [Ferruginibacter sp.]HNK28048.1 LytTR family DNA-binding domain-containing protein [Ferruginibacter sp.]HQR01715.1 LytTR family DNA-binding domain-containing protein [Ferruginibacter sp.]
MTVLIIDNENGIRETLKEMLQRRRGGTLTIEEADGVQTGLAKIASVRPDIVLLDVEMNDGTGFDLMNRVEDPCFQLIFITAYNQYAVQAFRVSAIDYLLKPIDPAALDAALDKAQGKINNQSLQNQLNILLQQFSGKNQAPGQIVLKDIDKTYFVRIEDILYCEAEGSYTKFYISNSEPIFVSRNLRSYEELLAPAGFIRTHHSCLVNPAKIRIYDRKTDCGTLVLEGGYTIPVSQRKKDFVIQFLEGR